MEESKDAQSEKKKLSLAPRGKLELKKTVETGQVRQSFSHGRSKTVQVEVKRKRTFAPGQNAPAGETQRTQGETNEVITLSEGDARHAHVLTKDESARRLKALQGAIKDEEARKLADIEEHRRLDEEQRRRKAEEDRRSAEEARRKTEEEERRRQAEEERRRNDEELAQRRAAEHPKGAKPAVAHPPAGVVAPAKPAVAAAVPAHARVMEPEDEESAARAKRPGLKADVKPKRPPARPAGDERRRTGKITVAQALDDSADDRVRSLAAVKRAREKERLRQLQAAAADQKVIREVVVPETITVQELANRMAERGADVIKSLMKMGVMATINQVIDADTAELIVTEFGHKLRRVAESDVEIGLKGAVDEDANLAPRPPIVTIMGHVDHGKTSLLDALRETDVAKHEAGGITQHIGAYQVVLASGKKITFIDTPGHAAFTEMRARGANVTDIVVLVVAADDSIMAQTVEAIRHAKAANVPIIVAINKIDKADANPDKVRTDLLQYEIQAEQLGGDVQTVEVSATKKLNLDKLEEAILLQAEILDLKANAKRPAEGTVVEAKLDRGRGVVATVLVQRGTLKVGDIVVAGSEWGRVRALTDDRGRKVDEAGPAAPVEVLGLNSAPLAGDELLVVENEGRARDVTAFRQQKRRSAAAAATARGTVEQIFSRIAAGEAKELPVVIKADVQGSIEAIAGTLQKLSTDEVAVRILHSGVGGINESDITLANASRAIVIGFNVRANPQARELARRDGVDIRYYSIIYNVIDDAKAMLGGLLAPTVRERFLGNAQILQVFNISKSGKVAGCRVSDGVVKRGAKVRLLRDNVVIHEGSLKTLKRFKDEVREVKEGFECGMAFESYQDIQPGDTIECFEMEEVARQLA
ncbi:MAG: translation initiation factor IF-2 [Alphaproteobacteria bacterium]|nr:translation initiation factor IF-2 [Alphaproteobacteria bacterium]